MQTDETKESKNKWRARIKQIVLVLLVPIVVMTFMEKTEVSGSSMLPTYTDGQHLLLLKHMPAKQNDVIVAKYNDMNPNFYIIKRVIACPGDSLKIQGNDVYVNNEKLDEAYIKEQEWNTDGTYDLTYVLGENEYFVMGDNRNESTDSRFIGPIQKKNIRGVICDKIPML